VINSDGILFTIHQVAALSDVLHLGCGIWSFTGQSVVCASKFSRIQLSHALFGATWPGEMWLYEKWL